MKTRTAPDQLNTQDIQALDSAHFIHPFTDHGDLAKRGALETAKWAKAIQDAKIEPQ